MEAHCIALELKYQNQALKSGQHGQILNETSNKANIKKEIDVLETMNIELEHSVAKLRKENETLKKHYKDFSDSGNLRKLKGNSVDTKFAKTSVLRKPVLRSPRNQSVVRQPNAFKSEGPQMSKQRDSSKNMPRFSSNDIVHNHYLDEARKKTQERDRNSKTNVTTSARFQSTADDSKPKPRSNNQTSRSLPVSKSSRVTIMAAPKADHSKSSISFSDSKQFGFLSTCHKITITLVDQKSLYSKPGRQIFTGHRFSPNKTSVVCEKTSHRSDLRWKPTGRIFKSVGLRSSLEPQCQMASDHVSSDPVPQCPTMALEHESLSLGPQSQENIPQAAETVTTLNELDLLFSPMFDELLNGTTPIVSKSSAVHDVDANNKSQQNITTQSSTTTDVADTPPLNIQTTPQTTNQALTLVPTVNASENII
ncbi:hypothetical protein Tco_0422720 [Tanacetum coccineum]